MEDSTIGTNLARQDAIKSLLETGQPQAEFNELMGQLSNVLAEQIRGINLNLSATAWLRLGEYWNFRAALKYDAKIQRNAQRNVFYLLVYAEDPHEVFSKLVEGP